MSRTYTRKQIRTKVMNLFARELDKQIKKDKKKDPNEPLTVDSVYWFGRKVSIEVGEFCLNKS